MRPKSYLSAFFTQNLPVFGAKNVHLQFHLKKSQINFYFSKEKSYPPFFQRNRIVF